MVYLKPTSYLMQTSLCFLSVALSLLDMLYFSVQGPRFPANTGFNNSKQAIQSMLRNRQPPTAGGYMQQPQIMNTQSIQKQMVRARLAQHYQANRMAENQVGMYSSNNPNSAAIMQMGQGMKLKLSYVSYVSHRT